MKVLLFLFFGIFSAVSAYVSFSARSHARSKISNLWGYVPSGMSPEQYKKLKEQENSANAKKNFGAVGPQSFKSRSLQSFQSDLEKGKANHLMPVFNAKEKLKAGKLKQQDIPYMQRGESGGNWDNSDVKSAKKKQWNEYDKKYNSNQKEAPLDWMGVGQRSGPSSKQKPEAPKKKNGWW